MQIQIKQKTQEELIDQIQSLGDEILQFEEEQLVNKIQKQLKKKPNEHYGSQKKLLRQNKEKMALKNIPKPPKNKQKNNQQLNYKTEIQKAIKPQVNLSMKTNIKPSLNNQNKYQTAKVNKNFKSNNLKVKNNVPLTVKHNKKCYERQQSSIALQKINKSQEYKNLDEEDEQVTQFNPFDNDKNQNKLIDSNSSIVKNHIQQSPKNYAKAKGKYSHNDAKKQLFNPKLQLNYKRFMERNLQKIINEEKQVFNCTMVSNKNKGTLNDQNQKDKNIANNFYKTQQFTTKHKKKNQKILLQRFNQYQDIKQSLQNSVNRSFQEEAYQSFQGNLNQSFQDNHNRSLQSKLNKSFQNILQLNRKIQKEKKNQQISFLKQEKFRKQMQNTTFKPQSFTAQYQSKNFLLKPAKNTQNFYQRLKKSNQVKNINELKSLSQAMQNCPFKPRLNIQTKHSKSIVKSIWSQNQKQFNQLNKSIQRNKNQLNFKTKTQFLSSLQIPVQSTSQLSFLFK